MSTPSRDVLVFWDYENCLPPSNSSGQNVADSIRQLAHQFGTIKVFKAYVGISDSTIMNSPKSISLRSQLQLSGVSLIDCPHIGAKNVADIMMIVDMITAAMDWSAETTTFLVITQDKDFTYALSALRLRRFQVVLIHKDQATEILKSRASHCFDWITDVLNKQSMNETCGPAGNGDPVAEPSKPRSRSRRASRASSFSYPAPTKQLPDAAPTVAADPYRPVTPASSSHPTEWESCRSSFRSSVHHRSSISNIERTPVHNIRSAPQVPTTGVTDTFVTRLLNGSAAPSYQGYNAPSPPANPHASLSHRPSFSAPTAILPNGMHNPPGNFGRAATNGISESLLESADSHSLTSTPETIYVHRPAPAPPHINQEVAIPGTSEPPPVPPGSSENPSIPIDGTRPSSPVLTGSIDPRSTDSSIPLDPLASAQSHTRQDLDETQRPAPGPDGEDTDALQPTSSPRLDGGSIPLPEVSKSGQPNTPLPPMSCPTMEREVSIISISTETDETEELLDHPTIPPAESLGLSRSSTVVPDTHDIPVYDFNALPAPGEFGCDIPSSEQDGVGVQAVGPAASFSTSAQVEDMFSPGAPAFIDEAIPQELQLAPTTLPTTSQSFGRSSPNLPSPVTAPLLPPSHGVLPSPSLHHFDFSRAVDAPPFQPTWQSTEPSSIPSTSASAVVHGYDRATATPPPILTAPLKAIPAGMHPLIQVLEELHAAGQLRPPKIQVLARVLALDCDVFTRTGVANSPAYFAKAESYRVAKMGTSGAPMVQWISLNEAWKTLYRDPRPGGVGTFSASSPVPGHGVSPQPSVSSLKPALPTHFASLVRILENIDHSDSKLPEGAVLRSALSHQLLQSDKQIYKTSGFGTFSAFAEAAEQAGIVRLGSVPGKPGSEWIRLLKWRTRYSSPGPTLESPSSNVAQVTTPKAPPKASSPFVKAEFQPLVKVMQKFRSQGSMRPTRIELGTQLNESVYLKAGVNKFKLYIALAEKADVVNVGGVAGTAWVSLNPEFA